MIKKLILTLSFFLLTQMSHATTSSKSLLTLAHALKNKSKPHKEVSLKDDLVVVYAGQDITRDRLLLSS